MVQEAAVVVSRSSLVARSFARRKRYCAVGVPGQVTNVFHRITSYYGCPDTSILTAVVVRYEHSEAACDSLMPTTQCVDGTAVVAETARGMVEDGST